MLKEKHLSDNELSRPTPCQGSVFSTQVRDKNIQLSAKPCFLYSCDFDENYMNFDKCDEDDVLPYIPLPQVDPLIVAKQQVIFKETWPTLTTDARQAFPKFAALYDAVKSYNLPNFLGAKKTVPSALNLQRWESELFSYHDREIFFGSAGPLAITYKNTQSQLLLTMRRQETIRPMSTTT